MSKRKDSSGYLYHWAKANINYGGINEWYESAYTTLVKILSSFELRSGASQGLSNGHSCICFTESPISFITGDNSKYQPFGLEFSKKDIYTLGGAQVFYCSRADYELLPQELKWRWMIHEPLFRDSHRPYGIDFTWEREVRVNSQKVTLLGESPITGASSVRNVDLAFNSIVVPNSHYKNRLLTDMEKRHFADAKISARDEREYEWLLEFYEGLLEQYELQIITLD